jgi:hypothetical protein
MNPLLLARDARPRTASVEWHGRGDRSLRPRPVEPAL